MDVRPTIGQVWNNLWPFHVLVCDAVVGRARLLPLPERTQPLDAEMYSLIARPEWPSRERAAAVQSIIDTHANNERLLVQTECDMLPLNGAPGSPTLKDPA